MSIFVDTSIFLPVLDESNEEHRAALTLWNSAIRNRTKLVTTNYVMLETIALVQRRLGLPAVQVFCDRVTPVLVVEWINAAIHGEALSMMRTANLRDLSLVDCTSFVVMRRLGIQTAYAFDQHFSDQGFTCLR